MNGFTVPGVHDKNADREASGHLLGIAALTTCHTKG